MQNNLELLQLLKNRLGRQTRILSGTTYYYGKLSQVHPLKDRYNEPLGVDAIELTYVESDIESIYTKRTSVRVIERVEEIKSIDFYQLAEQLQGE